HTAAAPTQAEGSPPIDVERVLNETRASMPVATETLVKASAAWLGLTFLICYLLVPAIFIPLNLGGVGIFNFWPQFPAFLLVSALVVAAVGVDRPQIKLGGLSRDPVLAATLGSFVAWGFLQETLWSFSQMGMGEMLALVGLNIGQSVLLGSMLASFTDRVDRAFSYGAGFQLATFVVSLFILGMSL
ncbi:MAG: hypothetical protein AAGA48_16795, partial [Myxococcota bacterium]